jgi:hypothetical protein
VLIEGGQIRRKGASHVRVVVFGVTLTAGVLIWVLLWSGAWLLTISVIIGLIAYLRLAIPLLKLEARDRKGGTGLIGGPADER